MKWASFITIAMMMCTSNQASAESAPLPYDGNVTQAYLLSGGHDIDLLYANLIDNISNMKKSEFETLKSFSDRKRQMRNEFIDRYGKNFLYVKSIELNNYMSYNASDNTMNFNFEVDSIEIRRLHGPMSFKYTDLESVNSGERRNVYTNNVDKCTLIFKQNMGVYEAKKLKYDTPTSYALNFRIMMADGAYPLVIEKNYPYMNASLKTSIFDGYTLTDGHMNNYIEVGKAHAYWESVEIILFKTYSGEIIYRSQCTRR